MSHLDSYLILTGARIGKVGRRVILTNSILSVSHFKPNKEKCQHNVIVNEFIYITIFTTMIYVVAYATPVLAGIQTVKTVLLDTVQ